MRYGALVLAAGAGRRFGMPKALAQIDGESFLRRAARALRDGGVAEIAVVGGCAFEALEQEARSLGLLAVFNPDWGGEMMSSIKLGVKALGARVDAFFVLPVDHPLVRPQTVRSLRLSWRKGMRCLVPTYKGKRGHPPMLSSSLVGDILRYEGEGGLSGFIRHLGCEELPVWDKGVVLGINTREDLASAEPLARRSSKPIEEECLELLSILEVPEKVVRHCLKVREVALKIAEFVDEVDVELLESASLLHDLARGRRRHDLLAHRFLRCLGLPEVAELVLRHMELADPGSSSWEQKILFLADKLVAEDELVGLEVRLQRALSKAKDEEGLASARRRISRAMEILDELKPMGFSLEVLLQQVRERGARGAS